MVSVWFYWFMNSINFFIITAQRLGISNKCIQLYLRWFLQILLEKVVYAKGGKVFSDENNFQVKGPIYVGMYDASVVEKKETMESKVYTCSCEHAFFFL